MVINKLPKENTMNLLTLTEELTESWINGNRNYVVDEILQLDKIQAIVVVMYVTQDLTVEDKETFINLLKSRQDR